MSGFIIVCSLRGREVYESLRVFLQEASMYYNAHPSGGYLVALLEDLTAMICSACGVRFAHFAKRGCIDADAQTFRNLCVTLV